jgi:hypothetical protein
VENKMGIKSWRVIISRLWTPIPTVAVFFLALSGNVDYAMDLEMGCSGGIGFISVPDWWLNMQSPVTSSLDLRFIFCSSYILEGAFTRVWNTQEWWNFNPNIWSISIEINTGKAINPRLGLDYYTGHRSRYGWNFGLHYVPAIRKKLSFSMLALLRFEDMYGGPGFAITAKPRGIFASAGFNYKW